MASFLKSIDLGLRGEIFSKFGTIMDMDSVNLGVIFYPKEIALKKIYEKRDTSELEFANVWRRSTGFDWTRQRSVLARRGICITNPNTGNPEVIKAVPVKLDYDVWFWTRDPDKINQVTEQYMLWVHTDPNLNLIYNEVYPMGFDLHFGDMEDEGTVREMHELGTYYVGRFPVRVDGWALSTPEDVSDGIIETIRLQIFDRDDLEESQYEEIVDEESSDYDEELATTLKLVTTTITS